MDPRFSKLSSDPRFIKLKKSATKTEIDARFQEIFTSEDFQTKKVDKRGRKVIDKDNELLKYYKLQAEDVVDLARGEGNVESSEEEFSEDEENGKQEEIWVEPEIPTGEETYRLACVNLDWDHVKATDLFKLFDGFKPQNGQIKKVSIFPSEFGKESMLKESFQGPPAEIFKTTLETKKSVQNDDGKDFNMVALRKYQMDRLKYYYAVIECDSVETAKAIFSSCDGAEFESSANLIDLRYIPDEMEFEDEPRDVAREVPIVYEGVEFVTDALQHSKVKLTWDEDDADRLKTTKRHFSKQDLKDMDFKAFLASSDGESDVDEELKEKYKALLANDDNSEDEGDDMEITFAPGLSEKAAKMLEEKKLREAEAEETVFERQLRLQKEKKKARKAAKLATKKTAESGSGSDSDHKDAFDDPFFQTALDSDDDISDSEVEQEVQEKTPKKEKKKTSTKKMTKEERLAKARSKAELELLLHDENEKVTHFNAKDIIKAEKSKSKKQKKKLQKANLDVQEEFDINLDDPRFKPLLEDHEYFIDPTNPHFKKTTTMKKILEKKRSIAQVEKPEEPKEVSSSKLVAKDLIDSVKRKVANLKSKSSKRQKKI